MDEDHIDPLCIIVVKSGAQGGKLLFKGSLCLDVSRSVLWTQIYSIMVFKKCD